MGVPCENGVQLAHSHLLVFHFHIFDRMLDLHSLSFLLLKQSRGSAKEIVEV